MSLQEKMSELLKETPQLGHSWEQLFNKMYSFEDTFSFINFIHSAVENDKLSTTVGKQVVNFTRNDTERHFQRIRSRLFKTLLDKGAYDVDELKNFSKYHRDDGCAKHINKYLIDSVSEGAISIPNAKGVAKYSYDYKDGVMLFKALLEKNAYDNNEIKSYIEDSGKNGAKNIANVFIKEASNRIHSNNMDIKTANEIAELIIDNNGDEVDSFFRTLIKKRSYTNDEIELRVSEKEAQGIYSYKENERRAMVKEATERLDNNEMDKEQAKRIALVAMEEQFSKLDVDKEGKELIKILLDKNAYSPDEIKYFVVNRDDNSNMSSLMKDELIDKIKKSNWDINDAKEIAQSCLQSKNDITFYDGMVLTQNLYNKGAYSEDEYNDITKV